MEQPNSLSLVLGRMRCLKALGEWQRLDDLSRDAWPRLKSNEAGLRAVAPHAARAAWALGDWDAMNLYISKTDEQTLQGAFFRAVLAVSGSAWAMLPSVRCVSPTAYRLLHHFMSLPMQIRRLSFDDAMRHIDRARRKLAAEFSASSGGGAGSGIAVGGGLGGMGIGGGAGGISGGAEAYSRSYRMMVMVQQLAEMEEVATYLRLQASGNALGAASFIVHLRHMWEARLRGCARNVDVWNRILSVRSLITVASENMGEWLQFASLCRRSGRLNMSLKVLVGLGMEKPSAPYTTLRVVPVPGADTAGALHITAPGSRHGSSSNLLRMVPRAGSASDASMIPPGVTRAALLVGSGTGSGTLQRSAAYDPTGIGSTSSAATASAQSASVLEAASYVGADSGAHPRVVYAFLKHLWSSGHREEAVDQLKRESCCAELPPCWPDRHCTYHPVRCLIACHLQASSTPWTACTPSARG